MDFLRSRRGAGHRLEQIKANDSRKKAQKAQKEGFFL